MQENLAMNRCYHIRENTVTQIDANAARMIEFEITSGTDSFGGLKMMMQMN